MLCFLFTQPLTPLFHREIYKAYDKSGIDEMRKIFLRYVSMFYSIAVCISTFFFFQSSKLTLIIGGEHFKGAVLPVAIMSLCPIHQTYGQLNSAIYLATGKTKLYRNIGLANNLFGFLMVYLFLAPKTQWGLELGSTGVALKALLIQILGQNFYLWYNTKIMKISFIRLLNHQFKSVIIIGGLSGLASLIANSVSDNMLISLLTAGLIYIIFLIGIIFIMPSLFSTNHSEIKYNIRLVREKLF